MYHQERNSTVTLPPYLNDTDYVIADASSLAKWPHPYLNLKRLTTQFPQVESKQASKQAKGCRFDL